MKNIYENIKRVRKSKGLTQKDISEKLGITQPNYTNFENGKGEITISRLEKLAEIFNISVGELLGLQETEKVANSENNERVRELEKELQDIKREMNFLGRENEILEKEKKILNNIVLEDILKDWRDRNDFFNFDYIPFEKYDTMEKIIDCYVKSDRVSALKIRKGDLFGFNAKNKAQGNGENTSFFYSSFISFVKQTLINKINNSYTNYANQIHKQNFITSTFHIILKKYFGWEDISPNSEKYKSLYFLHNYDTIPINPILKEFVLNVWNEETDNNKN